MVLGAVAEFTHQHNVTKGLSQVGNTFIEQWDRVALLFFLCYVASSLFVKPLIQRVNEHEDWDEVSNA
jgi:hypothetical protein